MNLSMKGFYMFSMFKKKDNSKDQIFMNELTVVAADFSHVIQAVDPEFAEELLSRAMNNYLERNPEEKNYTASDFYFDAFTGALLELTLNSVIAPDSSLAIFSMTDNFFRENPKYHTSLAMGLMDKWQSILIEAGAINITEGN